MSEVTKAKSAPLKEGTASIVLFGEEPAIVKLTPKGLVKAAKCRIRLSRDRDELWPMSFYDKAKDNGEGRDRGGYVTKFIPTAAGYRVINQAAGVSIIAAETILGEDGQPKANPYIHYNAAGEKLYVKIRLLGIGRMPTGNLTCLDYTLQFDLGMYFAQDVFAKWQGYQDKPVKEWGEPFAAESVPEEIKSNAKKRLIPVPGGIVLAVDLTNRDVIKLFAEHLNRQRFAERNARTIAENNIIKRFAAVTRIPPDGVIPVVSWPQADMEMAEVYRVGAAAAGGKFHLGDEEADVITEEEDADLGQVAADLTGDLADEDQRDTHPAGDAQANEGEDEDEAGAWISKIRGIWTQKREQGVAILKEHDMTIEQLATCRNVETLQAIHYKLMRA